MYPVNFPCGLWHDIIIIICSQSFKQIHLKTFYFGWWISLSFSILFKTGVFLIVFVTNIQTSRHTSTKWKFLTRLLYIIDVDWLNLTASLLSTTLAQVGSAIDWSPVFILYHGYRQAPCVPFKGFHWIRCAEYLTSCFEARGLATNQGQSWT